jgi:hypothetical protein
MGKGLVMNKRQLQQLGIAWLLFFSAGTAQQVKNGQQIVFGGIRFDTLEITGINQDGVSATWKSWGQFREGGVTLAYAEGWWWKSNVRIRASLAGKTVHECQTGPYKAGFILVFIVAQNNSDCLGDAQNSSTTAKLLERWMYRNRSQKKLANVKKMLETAEDAWMCAKILAGNDTAFAEKCKGVSDQVLQQIR